MRSLALFVLSAVLVAFAPTAAVATCYYGCVTEEIDPNDGVYVVRSEATECDDCDENEAFSYYIFIYPDNPCANGSYSPAHFCSDDDSIPVGWYYVSSIGSGCDAYLQGCVRLCSCE